MILMNMHRLLLLLNMELFGHEDILIVWVNIGFLL